MANMDMPWDYRAILCNPNLTLDFIKSNLEKPWNWEWRISASPIINMEFVNANPDKPWDWNALSENPSITLVPFTLNYKPTPGGLKSHANVSA